MRYLNALLLCTVTIVSCTRGDGLTIVHDETSDYAIVVSAEADGQTQSAAGQLQEYIGKVSGIMLRVSNDIGDEPYILVGRELLDDAQINAQLDTLSEDGFLIRTLGENILISGNDGKSNLYGVYTFIEEFLGCRLLTPTEEYIPKSELITVTKFNKAYIPAFAFRRMLFTGVFDEKYRHWHKVESLDEWGSFVHTFQKLVPPERYFESHPEFFSEINGRRLKDAQLCLSNSALIDTLIINLGKEIEKEPGKKYWSVSQNDCYNYCTCDDCNALYEKFGSYSGAYIEMANKIAEVFPEKQISTLAYQFTRAAPKNIVPRENVNIMFCSIECNRSMPLEDDPRSADFVKDMEDWARLTDNIFVWDYVVQFKNYLTPFPNFHVLQPNIQFFKRNNVGMMFQQGSSRNWSDLSELKQYVIAKLLWDPETEVDVIIDDFLDKYYGPAAPYLRTYFDRMHEAIIENRESEFLNIYGFPSDHTDAHLSPALLKHYRAIMDDAEDSVDQDSVYLGRVRRARLAVDFAYLDIALNRDSDDISYFNSKDSGRTAQQEMLDYLDRFVDLSVEAEAVQINERQFLTEDYRQYVLRKLRMMGRTNLARNKTVRLLTEASEKYPVGKEKALTDGLFGDLDFHNNWLGFEGEDMIVEIDLLEPQTVRRISMNFLKAVNSWIFLPVTLIIEGSVDGQNYQVIGNLTGDNSDRSYLVRSIPFDIEVAPTEIQYLRIKAISMKQCPEWHRGYGNPSWIFIDELIVE